MATEVQREEAPVATPFQDADEFSGLLKQSFKPRSERGILRMKPRQLVNDEADVVRTIDGIFRHLRRAMKNGCASGNRKFFPHSGIAAGVLQVNGNVTATRPTAPEIIVNVARTAEPDS